MRGATRRRSTSEGEGDRLSSTLNLPEAVQFNRFNSDRYASTPQVNTTGFIDDNYESSRGTHFEPRVRTRSRGATNTIDMRLRDDFSLLKGEILEWGENVCSVPQGNDAIESKYNAFLGRIEQKISEVLLTRGDLSLVGELASLRDRLNMFRKRAQRVSKECQRLEPQPEERVPVRESGEEYQEILTRSCELDYVFHDLEPIERSAVSAPSYGGGGAKRKPTYRDGAVAGSGSVQSGLESGRPVGNVSLQPHNASKEKRVDTRCETNTRSNERVPGVGGVRSVQSEPAHPSLNTPRIR